MWSGNYSGIIKNKFRKEDKMKPVPNLTFKNSLDYTIYLSNHIPKDDDEFNFVTVETCEPFPMLVTSTAIRQYRKRIVEHVSHDTKPKNCNNTYADTMRFYRATGINKGKSFDIDYGNCNYLPITRLDLKDLRDESRSNLEYIQDNIERKAIDMATVLSRNSLQLKKLLKYVLTEIMRNVPEHSNADSIWYCAQYWPTKDRVELAIIDEGIGIKNSLLSNYAYNDIIDSDRTALEYALKPGISSKFAPGTTNNAKDEWANSGFGLYMISSLCANLEGSFTIASGDSLFEVKKDTSSENLIYTHHPCSISGTALRIYLKPSKINDYESVARKLLTAGENIAKANGHTIHYASKSTQKIIEDF